MTETFAQPGPPTGDPFDFQEASGRLLLIEVTGYEEHVPTVHTLPGEKSPAVRANITVIDGLLAGKRANDTLIFPKVLQGQLRNSLGKMVLGRLGQGAAKPGKNAAWELAPATPDDIAAASTFVNLHPTTPPGVQTAQPPF